MVACVVQRLRQVDDSESALLSCSSWYLAATPEAVLDMQTGTAWRALSLQAWPLAGVVRVWLAFALPHPDSQGLTQRCVPPAGGPKAALISAALTGGLSLFAGVAESTAAEMGPSSRVCHCTRCSCSTSLASTHICRPCRGNGRGAWRSDARAGGGSRRGQPAGWAAPAASARGPWPAACCAGIPWWTGSPTWPQPGRACVSGAFLAARSCSRRSLVSGCLTCPGLHLQC